MMLEDRDRFERASTPPEIGVSNEELVLLDVGSGNYHTMHGAAGICIWRLLATPRSLTALVDALVDEFDIDRARCAAETVRFLDELAAKGLVRIAGPAPPAEAARSAQ